jgi:multicomponent Na+:H+ antiporter subunit E
MAVWFIVLVGAWWVIAEGRADGWPVALAAALAALAVRRRLGSGPFQPLRPLGLARFIPFFLWESLRGGVDVAGRALRPGLRLDPALLDYRVRSPAGPARTLFVGALSLLPGTFAADLDDDVVRIHTLDDDPALGARVARLERRAAAVFGIDVPDYDPDPHPGLPHA